MTQKPNYHRMLTLVSIVFIVFGVFFAALSVFSVLSAAYNLYKVGFWGGFVTAFTAIFDAIYAILVVSGGIWGLRRKNLDFCYKLGVLLAVFSVIRFTMSLSRVFMGAPFGWLFYLFSGISIALPILFVMGVSHAQKQETSPSDTASEAKIPE